MQKLSILSRGSLDEKLRWAFSLYDINGDGCITKEEMTDIVTAIYELMGKIAEPCVDEETIKEKVDRIFQVTLAWKVLMGLLIERALFFRKWTKIKMV